MTAVLVSMCMVVLSMYYLRGRDVEIVIPLMSGASVPVVPDFASDSGAISTTPALSKVKQPLFAYMEVMDGCGPYYNTGECVNMRAGPGTDYAVVARLRTGVVLRVEKQITVDGNVWNKIGFDNVVRYTDRLPADIYVSANMVRNFNNDGNHLLTKDSPKTEKNIVVDISEQTLSAYDGETLFMKEPVSTGLELTPTARGTFTIFKMTPARYMQGPLPGVSDDIYDLPGVPWNMYFTQSGAVIHGAYWHDHFGELWSHGCVNLSPQKAKKLYDWAIVGTKITIQN